MKSDAWDELLRTLKGFEIFCFRLCGTGSMLEVYYAHWYLEEWVCLREVVKGSGILYSPTNEGK